MSSWLVLQPPNVSRHAAAREQFLFCGPEANGFPKHSYACSEYIYSSMLSLMLPCLV